MDGLVSDTKSISAMQKNKMFDKPDRARFEAGSVIDVFLGFLPSGFLLDLTSEGLSSCSKEAIAKAF